MTSAAPMAFRREMTRSCLTMLLMHRGVFRMSALCFLRTIWPLFPPSFIRARHPPRSRRAALVTTHFHIQRQGCHFPLHRRLLKSKGPLILRRRSQAMGLAAYGGLQPADRGWLTDPALLSAPTCVTPTASALARACPTRSVRVPVASGAASARSVLSVSSSRG